MRVRTGNFGTDVLQRLYPHPVCLATGGLICGRLRLQEATSDSRDGQAVDVSWTRARRGR
ncbi:hypothetical protein BDP55DRAFT_665716 [Colletotrichum godetiae]|uniref:Uncharacterized protein n=1 Tax=Colletotrichum godetiae TaxID=1209918 RepID=A0AAJ0AJI9_9PEZI|nr:uncharacterized protein BDP55DRAFT_665716 [Colletotrichum godetiae]KAK1675064.1 hypothetical protein BDP55DRAFT_665716 [Colletotrichum godetiae]